MGKEGKKSKEKDREKISKKKAADGDKEHGKKAVSYTHLRAHET